MELSILNFKKWNKKGSMLDSILVPATILVTAITIFIMLFVWDGFSAAILPAVADSPSNATIVQTIADLRASYLGLDYVFPVLVGGLLIVSLVFAFKTGASVLFAFLSLILWAIALLMSAVYTNVYLEFKNQFVSLATELTTIDFIMMNMKWIVLAWAALISIVMFTRSSKEDKEIRYGGASEMVFQQ